MEPSNYDGIAHANIPEQAKKYVPNNLYEVRIVRLPYDIKLNAFTAICTVAATDANMAVITVEQSKEYQEYCQTTPSSVLRCECKMHWHNDLFITARTRNPKADYGKRFYCKLLLTVEDPATKDVKTHCTHAVVANCADEIAAKNELLKRLKMHYSDRMRFEVQYQFFQRHELHSSDGLLL